MNIYQKSLLPASHQPAPISPTPSAARLMGPQDFHCDMGRELSWESYTYELLGVQS